VDVRAKLKQSEIDREKLEGLLSSHHAEVLQTMTKVQDWVQDQQDERKKQRQGPGAPKRNASGIAKASIGGVGTFVGSSSVAGSANHFPRGGKHGCAILPRRGSLLPKTLGALPDLPDSGSDEVVPSSSHSSLGSSPDHSDTDAK
jgi:hypothetical protein